MKLFQALLAGLSFFERLERYIKFYSNYDLFEGTMSLRSCIPSLSLLIGFIFSHIGCTKLPMDLHQIVGLPFSSFHYCKRS